MSPTAPQDISQSSTSGSAPSTSSGSHSTPWMPPVPRNGPHMPDPSTQPANAQDNRETEEDDTRLTDDDPLQDAPTGPIIAICSDLSRCGCAIYTDACIQLVADKRDSTDPYKSLDIVLQRVSPQVVLVSAVQSKLIKHLEATSFKVETVPNSWFSISLGTRKLLNSEWTASRCSENPEERLLFVTSKVNKSVDVCAVRSISAVEQYLIQTTIHSSSADWTSAIATQISLPRQSQTQQLITQKAAELNNIMPVISVSYIDPGPVLSIDNITLECLGIFSSPREKEKLKQNQDYSACSAEADEIPTLYSVLNLCQSHQGRRQMRSLMMWPLQDTIALEKRYDAIEFFMNQDHASLRDQILTYLKSLTPVGGLLSNLSQKIVTHSEMTKLYQTLWTAITIVDLIRSYSTLNPTNVEILQRISASDCIELREVVESIVGKVDFEASKKEKRVQVLLGVDELVDEKKKVASNLTDLCNEIGCQETEKYRNTLAKICRVIYVPRIGFLTGIDYNTRSELSQIQSNKEFNVMLHTETSIYFKTKRMEELDRRAGDVACDLIDVQEDVVLKLQNDILKYSEVILRIVEMCGELDCLIALAIVSTQRGYTRPEIVSSEEDIEIESLYHPLRAGVVSNNVCLSGDMSERRRKIMIITGPNSCGKTTFMKATCLAVYMAHIGCFVPAKKMRLPVMDAILTRIHAYDSVSTGLSSFAADLQQINNAVTRATEKSLIAIDEFGEGTLTIDGFTILKNLIIHFANLSERSPYVLISTHFIRIVDQLQSYSNLITYRTFKVSREPSTETFTYEYLMIPGVGEMSLAMDVAKRAGIPRHLIERAEQFKSHTAEGREVGIRPPHAA